MLFILWQVLGKNVFLAYAKTPFLSVLSIPSGWGHPLGQVCFPFPLDLDRRITLAFGFCSFRWAPGSGSCACRLFLGWASSFASVWLSFCYVGFLFLVSFLDSTCWPFSPPFLLWLSLVLVARCFLGPFSSSRVFTLRFGWSSGRLVAFCVPWA